MHDDEPTEAEQAELDEALGALTEKLERATTEARHQLAILVATCARDEVALLERMWKLR